jgi:hypothetical protein
MQSGDCDKSHTQEEFEQALLIYLENKNQNNPIKEE